jgi:type I restriction enzyme S subunit
MNNDWFFEKFALIADAPGAVTRMREFILDLASAGKLVPEVLEKPVPDELCRLEEHVTLVMGQAPPGEQYNTNGKGTLFVKVGEFGLLYPRKEIWTTSPLKYAKLGDVLICVVGATVGKLNLAIDCAIGRSVAALRPAISMDTKFLYYSLMPYTIRLRRNSRGSAQGVIGKTELNAIELWVPTIGIQKRIVAKVDELLGLCDALEAQQQERELRKSVLVRSSLSRFAEAPTPENLGYLFHKSYDIPPSELRKSILTLAVQGKLVPQDPSDEPAEKEVAATRREKGLPMATVPSEQLSDELFEVPTSWCWVKVNDVAENRLGKMLDEEKNSGTPQPYLRNTNVHWFHFDLKSIKTILMQPQEVDEFRLARGDVMICEGGHGIARTAVWENQIPGVVFQKALHRVRPFECLNPYFFAFCIRVYEALGTLAKYYTGAGIPHFTGRSLAKLVFPLPPLAEQHRIVAKVDQLMALVDELERQQEASREKASKLLDAIVQEMTSGGRDIAATLES